MAKFTLLVHGGAGDLSRGPTARHRERKSRLVLKQALLSGFRVLKKGGTAVDAVVIAVKVLEDSPLFNAARGSVLTHRGGIEMDAAVMDGKTLSAGAVAGIRKIKNPIEAAAAVMRCSQGVLLVGKGAEQFAAEQGLKIVDQSYFIIAERRRQLRRIRNSHTMQLDHDSETEYMAEDTKLGTVGAVALDQYGNLAAGTSTGGLVNERFGRVGDSPIIGAGTYADNESVAVSATGTGESFIRSVCAHEIAARVKYCGLSVGRAAKEVVKTVIPALGGRGGVIALDRAGHYAMPRVTRGMYRGLIRGNGRPRVWVFD